MFLMSGHSHYSCEWVPGFHELGKANPLFWWKEFVSEQPSHKGTGVAAIGTTSPRLTSSVGITQNCFMCSKEMPSKAWFSNLGN
jgi:hypothetical protein